MQWHGYQSQLLNSVTPNYHRNVINAFATAPAFANRFNNLGGGRLIVAGHSLGNILISSAIQDHGLSPHSFFMLNAAVAQEAYDERDIVLTDDMMHSEWYDNGWYGGPHPNEPGSRHRLWASRWHELFADTGDARETLTWRGRFNTVSTRTNVHNFRSSGEEVLADHSAATAVPSVFGYALSQIGETFKGTNSWALQEKLKGRTFTNNFGGSYYGGWGLNPHEWATRERVSRAPRRQRSYGNFSSYQTDMPSEALKERPFFNPYRRGFMLSGPADVRDNLYNSNGSSFVSSWNSNYSVTNRDRLLAKMIPAESFSVGANTVTIFNERGSNFNMQSDQGRTGWPAGRDPLDPKWRHSDLRKVAYVFTKKTFDQIVTRGGLKNEN